MCLRHSGASKKYVNRPILMYTLTSVESLWNRANAKLEKGKGMLLGSYVKEATWRESLAMDQQKEVFSSILL